LIAGLLTAASGIMILYIGIVGTWLRLVGVIVGLVASVPARAAR
jgi:hypothetical protein